MSRWESCNRPGGVLLLSLVGKAWAEKAMCHLDQEDKAARQHVSVVCKFQQLAGWLAPFASVQCRAFVVSRSCRI